MNFEFLILNGRYLQFLLYGMLLMFVFYSCTSGQTRIPAKLDLSEEKQLVEDLKNLEPEQKQVILNAFDRAESVNESVRLYARQLETENAKLKTDLVSEKEDAASYRKWRFWVLAVLVGLALWQTSKYWLPIAKRFLGIPV
jgi:hypothetical protein